MMKLLLPLISFLVGSGKNFFKEPGVALTQQLVLHLRALTSMLVATIVSLVIFCVGLSFFISSFAKQLDSGEAFAFTGSMILFSSVTLLSLGVLIYSLRRQTWLKTLGFEERPPQPKQSGALENAVALLVMDFVEERQNKRNSDKAS